MTCALSSAGLTFSVDENGTFSLSAPGTPMRLVPGSDLFRLHLDDGYLRDLTVFGAAQTGVPSQSGDSISIVYDSVSAENGRRYDIRLTVHIDKTPDGLLFHADIDNRADIRVNEIQLPYFCFDCLCDESRDEDTLYLPYGLGERRPNPWEWVRTAQHSEYMAADYNQVQFGQTYPFPCSMAWFGIETGGHFLYLGRHDDQFRTCRMNVANAPRHKYVFLTLSLSHYPAVRKGETICCAPTLIALLTGSWLTGSALYRRWADSWYVVPEKPEWVKNMTGWQRIILRHQYGELFFTYEDIVRAYREGRKAGLDTVLVFGWWKGRFDNGYPLYEPDPEMGGVEGLSRAIKTVQDEGGHVILYNNGVLIDVAGDYYKKEGWKVCRLNIEGCEYREFYQFSNNGTLLKEWGYKTFASACMATDSWHDKLIENARIKLAFKPDSIFFDQVGGHLPRPCFNPEHKHGFRIDTEATWRMKNLADIKALVSGETAVGTENTVDVFSQFFHYHHGHMSGTWYEDYGFPEMYRQTFPECIITNRLLHDDRADMKRQLNFAFMIGHRFDVSIYRGHRNLITDLPDYAAYVKKLTDLREQYHDFFYHGTFCLSNDYVLPKGCHLGEFH